MNPLQTPLENLLAAARYRHALDGQCSHPSTCEMACAIEAAELALLDLAFTAEVPPFVVTIPPGGNVDALSEESFNR